MAKQISAGLLLYNLSKASPSQYLFNEVNSDEKEVLKVFLVHPGGPFFRNKDKGVWTIPKGLIDNDEDLLLAARREFKEETGLLGVEPFIELGAITQKSGKQVFAWAFTTDLPKDYKLTSNTFKIELPKGSGKTVEFAEIDKWGFFTIKEAQEKILPEQYEFINRLLLKLRREKG